MDFNVMWFCVYINYYSSSILALCTLHFILVRLDVVVVTERDGVVVVYAMGRHWEGETLHHQTCLNNRVDLFLCYHVSLFFSFLFL